MTLMRRAVKLSAALLLMSASNGTSAQDMWGNYCAPDPITNARLCRTTLEQLLDAWNASMGYNAKWRATGESVKSSTPGAWTFAYRWDFRAPKSHYTFLSIGGFVADNSSGFTFAPGCSYNCTEEQLVSRVLSERSAAKDIASHELSGDYDDSFGRSNTKYLTFGHKNLEITFVDGTKETHTINKFGEYTCELTAGGNIGYGIGRAPPERQASQLAWTQLCAGKRTIWVTAALQQRDSCPINANPCYPMTGTKSRFEEDFVFAGRPFIRSYHSSQQASMPGLAAGWWSSFGERASTSALIDERGYFHPLKFDSTAARYHSTLSTDRWLVRTSTGFVSRHAGTHRDYDSSGRLLRVYDPTSPNAGVSVTHDIWGRIQRLTDAQGRSADFQYSDASSEGLLTEVRLPGGGVVKYIYDDANRLSAIERQDGTTRNYIYDEPALSASARKGMLTGIVAEGGVRLASFGYDARGRVLSSALHDADTTVERTHITYAPTDARAVTDGVGERLFEVRINEVAVPTSIALTGAGTETRTYTAGRLTGLTDVAGRTSSWSYVGSRVQEKRTAIGTAAERHTVFEYGTEDVITKQTERGYVNGALTDLAVATIAPNSRGQSASIIRTDPLRQVSRSTTNIYCEQSDVDAGMCPSVGLLLSVDGPRTDAADFIRFTYYPSDAPGCDAAPETCSFRKGDLWAVENAMGHITETLRYDGAGRPLQTKDANGIVTDLEYHPRGWLTARKVRGAEADSESDDAIMRIDYWPAGQVKQVTQPDGTYTTYTYDDAHRLTAIADNAGNKIEYTLDNAGNRTKEDTKDAQGALRRTLSRVFNQLGQLQTAKDAYSVPTAFTYDAAGNADTVTDAKGRVTDNDYGPLNRLARTLQDTAGIRAETKFEYDALDNLTKVVDPKGLSTSYTYNGLGDLTQLTSPDTGTTTYTYDSAGNRASQTDARGVTTQYLYDALNRLTQILYPTISLNVTYTYDSVNSVCGAGENYSLGRMTRMADGSGNTQYCYDRWGNLVRKVQTTNGKVFTTRYAYNLAGRLTRLVYPSGMAVDYGLNSLGQPSSVTVTRPGQAPETLIRDVKYHAFGPVAEIAYGTSGRVQKRGVDANYRPNVVEDGVSLNLGLGWDEVGNLSSLVDTHPSNAIAKPLRGYRYDTLNRLDQIKNGAKNSVLQTYTYDATGNRTSFKPGTSTTQTYTYPATSHRLTQAGTVARTYDAVGNTISIGGTAREFIYDATNRMAQLKKNGAVAMNYAYNGKGERVRRFTTATSTAQTYSVYDETGRWIGEYKSNGTRAQEYIWLDDLPVGLHAPTPASTTTFQLYHIQADHLGTPRTIIDPVRNVAVWNWALTGEAFGNSAPAQNPDGDGKSLVFDMRFPGQRYDSATLLNYNYFRDYDRTTGRYVESDPIGLSGGISTYAYANSAPTSLVDPLGLAVSGPLVVCNYYLDRYSKSLCRYYLAAFLICNSADVNPVFRRDPAANGRSLQCVRTCLVIEDSAAHQIRRAANCTGDGCLSDGEIDSYHRVCFSKCGLNPNTYPGVGSLN